MGVIDFSFQNADTKGRNLDYVLWLGIFTSALINVTQDNLFETFIGFIEFM